MVQFSGYFHRSEAILLGLMLYAFWFPIEMRINWLWLLGTVPIFILVRCLIHKRLFTRFPLDMLFIILIGLMLFNLRAAPYHRDAWILGRPLFGMALCVFAVEHIRQYANSRAWLVVTMLLVLLVGGLALFSSQWNTKSDQLRFIIDALPRVTGFPGAETGFNANEIAGALTWLVPFSAGAALAAANSKHRWMNLLLRLGFGAGFVMSFMALFLGQSRFGLLGVLIALAALTPAVFRRWRWRSVAWAALLALGILEILIIRNVFSPAKLTTQIERDEDSLSARLEIWNSALEIVRDYPLTGVGMNLFRDGKVRERYPVPMYPQSILPHAHNEFLQLAADLGIPGLLWWCGIYAAVGCMLWRVYRTAGPSLRLLAAAVAAALLAHLIFSLGDAVPIWDRFGFIYWWMLAAACILDRLNSNAQVQPDVVTG